jgi:uncharacterized protein YjbJ (UPF0337 family)
VQDPQDFPNAAVIRPSRSRPPLRFVAGEEPLSSFLCQRESDLQVVLRAGFPWSDFSEPATDPNAIDGRLELLAPPCVDRQLLKEAVMDKEHIKGAADKAKGAVKDAAGKMMGDKGLQAEGKMDKAKGEARQALGDAKDAVRHANDR